MDEGLSATARARRYHRLGPIVVEEADAAETFRTLHLVCLSVRVARGATETSRGVLRLGRERAVVSDALGRDVHPGVHRNEHEEPAGEGG